MTTRHILIVATIAMTIAATGAALVIGWALIDAIRRADR